jgi:hypothetical protein
MRLGFVLSCLMAGTIALLATACDDDGSTATPSATPPPSPSAAPSPSPTPAAPAPTPLASPAPQPSASPTATATPGRVDGTVAPQNAGATDPVTIKANPDPPSGIATLVDVRIGAHPEEGGWDRIVFEFRDVLPAGAVAYVPSVIACGSGAPVTLPGQARLVARFTGAQAHDDAGRSTIVRTSVPGPGAAIVEARQVCDFEGHVEWAIGVVGVQRFKVTLLDAPRRVVIDVKR